MEKAEMIRKMTAAGIDLETALDIALGGKEPEVKTKRETAPDPQPEVKPEVKTKRETAPDPQPEVKPEVKPELEDKSAGISQEMGAQLLAAITKLTGAVQRSNIVSLGSDDAGETQQDKVDKMLTRFLTGDKSKED